jgi:hypothetical protein
MTLDLALLCIFGVPIPGIARSTMSAGHLILRDGKLVTLARLNNEIATPAFSDLANDGASKEAMSKAVCDKSLKVIYDFAHLCASLFNTHFALRTFMRAQSPILRASGQAFRRAGTVHTFGAGRSGTVNGC